VSAIERLVGAGAVVVVVAGVGLGFAALGPPAHVRDEELDAQALQRLSLPYLQRPAVRCADFRLPSPADAPAVQAHPAGHVCFRFRSDGTMLGTVHHAR
jgi:hypothetical protein